MADRDDESGAATTVGMAEGAKTSPADATLTAPRSHRTVRLGLSQGQERLDIVSPSGKIELTVVLTDHGPKLVFESADIQIVTPNHIAVECQSLEIKAKDELCLAGASTNIAARSGDVKIEANDRVRLVGEQIRLNCDGPDRVPPWMQREIAAELASTLMPSLVPRRDHTGDPDLGQAGDIPSDEDPNEQ